MKKTAGIALVFMMIVLLLGGCSKRVNTYTFHDFSIELPASYRFNKIEALQEDYWMTSYGKNISFFVEEVPFSTDGIDENDSLERFAEWYTSEKYDLDAVLTERGGTVSFTYEGDSVYYAFCFKGSRAFYLAEFCASKGREPRLEDRTTGWIESVQVK